MSNNKRKTVVVDAAFREVYASDASLADIAKRYGVTEKHVQRLGKENGLPFRSLSPYGSASAVDPEAFAKLWADGVKVADIAAQFGICASTVRRVHGILKLPSRRTVLDLGAIDRAALIELWFSQATRCELIAALGVPSAHLVPIRAHFGLPPRLRYSVLPREDLASRKVDYLRHQRAAAQAEAAAKVVSIEAPVFEVGGAPHWTPACDQRVLDSGGRYGELTSIAQEFGFTAQAVLARWHLVRAAA